MINNKDTFINAFDNELKQLVNRQNQAINSMLSDKTSRKQHELEYYQTAKAIESLFNILRQTGYYIAFETKIRDIPCTKNTSTAYQVITSYAVNEMTADVLPQIKNTIMNYKLGE